MSLKNEVFHAKTIPFHWNLDSIIETKGNRSNENYSQRAALNQSPGYNASTKNFSYEVGSFVAVNTDIDEGHEFWIGKVVDVHRGKQKKVDSLSVHWFECYGNIDIYQGRYRPHFLLTNSDSKNRTPWTDKISTDTVLVSFPSLTSDKKIRSNVSIYLREHFSMKRTRSATVQNKRNHHKLDK